MAEVRGMLYKLLANVIKASFKDDAEVFNDPEPEARPATFSSDRLKMMWDQQDAFMKLLQCERGFPDYPVNILEKSGQRHVKEIVQDAVTELYEALFELKNTKNHRATDIKEFNREHFIEEMVDAQHFLFEALIMMGVTQDEFFETYISKGERSVIRIKTGY